MKTRPAVSRLILPFAALGLSVVLGFLIITGIWIGRDVNNACRSAIERYGQDCVGSLIQLLNDEHQPFARRNTAIWALGQLGDTRASGDLQSYVSGTVPAEESLSAGISQYELVKAIRLIQNGINITAVVWRNDVVAPYAKKIIPITSFADCAGAGYPIAESYPEQCRTPSGEVFINRPPTP